MDFFTFLLAVLLLELTPGPNMAYLAPILILRQVHYLFAVSSRMSSS